MTNNSMRDICKNLKDEFNLKIRLITENIGLTHKIIDQLLAKEEQYLSKIEELQQSLESANIELRDYRRDKTSTYVAGNMLQNHDLVSKYISIKENYLRPLAQIICNQFTDSKEEKKRQLSKVRSTVAREILIRGQLLMRGETIEIVDSTDIFLSEISKDVQKKLNIQLESDNIQELKLFLTKDMSYALTSSYPKPGNWQEKYISKAVIEIASRIYTVFKLPTDSLDPHLKNTIRECLNFLEEAACTELPGTLHLEIIRAKFDASRHELVKGSSDSGIVAETNWPSYIVGDRVIVKADVWLESELPATQNITEKNRILIYSME